MFKNIYVPNVTASNVSSSNIATGNIAASNALLNAATAKALTAAGTVSNLPVNCMYSSNVEVRNAMVWTATGGTTSNGQATFYVTSDNTSKGAALFKNVLYASATATTNNNMVMYCGLSNISVDNKAVVFNVAAAGGMLSSVTIPNGTVVRAMVIGL